MPSKTKYKAIVLGKPEELIDPIISITINNGYGDYLIPIEDWEYLRIQKVKF